jgi:hypothetical protein
MNIVNTKNRPVHNDTNRWVMNNATGANLDGLYRKLCLLLLMILLPGCSVYRGHFVADRVPGWSVWRTDGVNRLFYPTDVRPKFLIILQGYEKGKLELTIRTRGRDPFAVYKWISHSDKPIRVLFHDKPGELSVPATALFVLGPVARLNVGNSEDFTVIIPTFKVKDTVIPELSVRVRWSDKRYFVWSEVM